MDGDNGDSGIFRFPDIDLNIAKPESSATPSQLPLQQGSKDGRAMFAYLSLDLGPVATRTFDIRSRPAWPSRPLDFTCTESVPPRPDVLELVRSIQPKFDPEEDSRAWCSVVEMVRSVGRSAEEARRIGYDELATLLQVHSQRLRFDQGNFDVLVAKLFAALTPAEKKKQPRRKIRKISLDEQLERFTRVAVKFAVNGPLEDIAEILGCVPSSFYDCEFFIKHLQPARNSAKKPPPDKTFQPNEARASQAQRDHEAEIEEIDARIDAEG